MKKLLMMFLLSEVVSACLASAGDDFREIGNPATEQDKAAIQNLLRIKG